MGSYPTVVDWNNDNKHDLLVGDAGGNIHIYLNTTNNTSPVLDNGTTIQAGGVDLLVANRATPVVDDWNSDGKKDLLVGDWQGNISVFLNEGTDAAPEYNSSAFLEVGGEVFDIDAGLTAGGRAAPRIYDWNNDGKKDLLVGEVFGGIYFLENVGTNAAPVFDSAEQFLLSNGDPLKFDLGGNIGPRSRIFVTDWNEDGLADVIVGGENGTLELYMAPEPVSSSLMLIGGVLLGMRRMRKKKGTI